MGEWEIYRSEKRARLPDAADGALLCLERTSPPRLTGCFGG